MGKVQRVAAPVLERFLALPGTWRVIIGISLVALAAAYLRGLFVPLMNNDSGHHAIIALNMVESGDYTGLYFRGQDYLDKPHFLFWTAAASFNIFGVNAFAYRLPSFLFTLLALYATFRFGQKLYNRRTGLLSATILATSYAFMLANVDVRMDAILTAAIIFATWQLIAFTDTRSWRYLIGSALGLAIGFSTKGMIGLAMPGIAVFFYIVQKRNWKSLLAWRWVLLAAVVLLLLFPEIYSFYRQFDAHPEKTIRGVQHPSGIAFLLFGQSLERYRGEAWGSSGAGDPLLFVHTFFWAFLPWCLLAIPALWQSVRGLIADKFRDNTLFPLFLPATIGVIFLLISGSSFKLPHYLNILLPFYALITGAYLARVFNQQPTWMVNLQRITSGLMVLAGIVLSTWVFPVNNFLVASALILLCAAYLVVAFRYRAQAFLLTLTASAFVFIALNFNFYPHLLQYQAGNVLASYVREHPGIEDVYYLDGHASANSFDVHLGKIIHTRSINALRAAQKRALIYTDAQGVEALRQTGIPMTQLTSAFDYTVSRLNKKLLNPARRGQGATRHYLLRVY